MPFRIFDRCQQAVGTIAIVRLVTHWRLIAREPIQLIVGRREDVVFRVLQGLMLAIAWNNRVPQLTEPGRLDACIDGVAAASNCFTIGGVEVGNFSFLEGEFDDWEYSVHWIENRSCDRCVCFCYENDATTETFSCPPATLYLNLTNEAFCAGIEGSYGPAVISFVTKGRTSLDLR